MCTSRCRTASSFIKDIGFACSDSVPFRLPTAIAARCVLCTNAHELLQVKSFLKRENVDRTSRRLLDSETSLNP